MVSQEAQFQSGQLLLASQGYLRFRYLPHRNAPSPHCTEMHTTIVGEPEECSCGQRLSSGALRGFIAQRPESEANGVDRRVGRRQLLGIVDT